MIFVYFNSPVLSILCILGWIFFFDGTWFYLICSNLHKGFCSMYRLNLVFDSFLPPDLMMYIVCFASSDIVLVQIQGFSVNYCFSSTQEMGVTFLLFRRLVDYFSILLKILVNIWLFFCPLVSRLLAFMLCCGCSLKFESILVLLIYFCGFNRGCFLLFIIVLKCLSCSCNYILWQFLYHLCSVLLSHFSFCTISNAHN